MPVQPSALVYLASVFLCAIFLNCLPAMATNPPALTSGTMTSGTSLGYYSNNQQSVVMTADSGATIKYSTDGSDPTSTGQTYSSGTTGIMVPNYTTVKAVANLSGVNSAITTAYVEYEVPRSGLQLWLKPENMVVSSGNLTSWTDVSGNNTSITQSTSANQPTVLPNALYGFSSANFNGATSNSSYLNIASSSTLSQALFFDTINGGVSIFAVINPNTSSAAKTLFTASATGTTDLTALQTNASNVTFNANNNTTAGSITTSSSPLTTGSFQILDVVYLTTPVATVDVNTVQATSAGTLKALRTPISRPVSYIGGNNALLNTAFWGGQLVELLCYNRNFTTTERALVCSYLANRYQLNTSIATPAPLISVPTATLTDPTSVAISAAPNAVVYYTLTGAAPVPGTSPVYSSPINVYYSLTVNALAVANGISSPLATPSVFTLDSTKWPAPSTTDANPLQINLQLPTTSIPQ